MQTKVNGVAIRATNATGAGKTSTLKIGDKIIVTVTLSETVVVTGEPTYTDCISAAGSKSTAFGALASTVIVFALLATACKPKLMALLSAQQMPLVLARPARLK
jgi:protoporphyrinogen oxidase